MSTRRKLNIKLLKRLRMRFLRMKHREHFNMNTIAQKTDCGTVMCIAGHVLDLAGYKQRVPFKGAISIDFISSNGRKVNALPTAARELGMRYAYSYAEDDAFGLFHDYKLKTPKEAAERIEGLIRDATD